MFDAAIRARKQSVRKRNDHRIPDSNSHGCLSKGSGGLSGNFGEPKGLIGMIKSPLSVLMTWQGFLYDNLGIKIECESGRTGYAN